MMSTPLQGLETDSAMALTDVGQLPRVLPRWHVDLLVAEFDTEYVVFDARSRMVHRIAGRHSLVFNACDGETNSDDLVTELIEAGLGSTDDVRDIVATALTDLANLGLLEGTVAPTPPPCIGCGAEANKRRRRRLAPR